MPAPEGPVAVAQLAGVLSAHAWNGDCTQLAFCPNNNEVHIYKASPDTDPSTWERLHILKEHEQVISALDWAASSNKLLSCSHDRNLYVWTSAAGSWSPALVVHQLNRAAVCARWSASEAKFAVGSGAKAICVCYYEEENNWWVGKIVKKRHESTVLGVAWHPNSLLLATASSDFKCRLFAAQIKGVDDSATKRVLGSSKFGTTLAFASHGSCAHFVDGLDLNNDVSATLQARPAVVATVAMEGKLPLLDVHFLSDRLMVGVGFDCVPLLFARGGDGRWSLKGEIAGEGTAQKKEKSAFSETLSAFKSQAERGESAPAGSVGAPRGIHHNSITSVRALPGRPFQFSTSGTDGKLVLWGATEALAARLASMSIS